MGKGIAPMFQSIFMIVIVAGFTFLLVILIVFSNNREIAIAIEETKITGANNAYSNVMLSLNEFWDFASGQALYLLEKDSESWDWKSVTKDFAQVRLAALSADFLADRDIRLGSAHLVLSAFNPLFTIEDAGVKAKFNHKLAIEFFQAKIGKDVTGERVLGIPLLKMIDDGRKMEENIRAAAASSRYGYADTKASYERNTKNSLYTQAIAMAIVLSDRDVALKPETSGVVIQTSADKSGIDLLYSVKVTISSVAAQYGYFDGSAFAKKRLELTENINGKEKALDCASRPGRYSIARFGDAICSAAQLYTCGTPFDGIEQNMVSSGIYGNYACTGSYFCEHAEKDGSQSCCAAFGGSWDKIDVCANPDCTEIREEYECRGGA